MITVTRSRLTGLGELMLPGAGIGAAAGLMVGLISLSAGLPFGLGVVNTLAFGIPMALFGGGYTVLCAYGVTRVGTFGPAALFWVIAFPVSRILQEATAGLYLTGRPALTDPLWALAAYCALLAPGLAFGFIWLHEKFVPPWVLRIRDHNQLAAGLAQAYVVYASRVYEQKQRQQARKRAIRAARAARRSA